jgi:DNA-binding response OmpR family regulator
MTPTKESLEPSRGIPSAKPNLLILDDEVSVRKLLVRLLARDGYAIHETGTVAEAYAVAQSLERLDVWVTDAHVEDSDASREVERFRALHPRLAIVLVSGCDPDIDRAEALDQLGVVFLAKPFSPLQLHEAVDLAFRHGMAGSTTVPLIAGNAVAQPNR